MALIPSKALTFHGAPPEGPGLPENANSSAHAAAWESKNKLWDRLAVDVKGANNIASGRGVRYSSADSGVPVGAVWKGATFQGAFFDVTGSGTERDGSAAGGGINALLEDAATVNETLTFRIQGDATDRVVTFDGSERQPILLGGGGFGLTGTVTMTNGSTAVTGSGTSFTSQIVSGQYIKLDADALWAQVLSVTDDTNLVLKTNYGDVGGAGSAEGATSLGVDPKATFLAMVDKINAALNTYGAAAGVYWAHRSQNRSYLFVYSLTKGSGSSITLQAGSEKLLTALQFPRSARLPVTLTGKTPVYGQGYFANNGIMYRTYWHEFVELPQARAQIDYAAMHQILADKGVGGLVTGSRRYGVYLGLTDAGVDGFRRTNGATSIAATREFTTTGSSITSSNARANTGIELGDELELLSGTDAGEIFTIVDMSMNGESRDPGNLNLPRIANTNECKVFTVDRDFPTGGESGVDFRWHLKNPNKIFFQNNSHAAQDTVVLSDYAQGGLRGVAPDVTYIPIKISSSNTRRAAAIDAALTQDVDIVRHAGGGTNGFVNFVSFTSFDSGLLNVFPGGNNANEVRNIGPGQATEKIMVAGCILSGWQFNSPVSMLKQVGAGDYATGTAMDACAPAQDNGDFSSLPLSEAVTGNEQASHVTMTMDTMLEQGYNLYSDKQNFYIGYATTSSSVAAAWGAGVLALIIEGLGVPPRTKPRAQLTSSIFAESALQLADHADPTMPDVRYGAGLVQAKKAYQLAKLMAV